MPDFDWQNVILGHLLSMDPLNITEEPFVNFAESLSSVDLADIGHLTLKRAARQCEKACGNFREMAAEFCECGPSLECHILGTCLPKCGLEAYVWPRAHQQGLTAVAVSPDGAVVATASYDADVKIWDSREELLTRCSGYSFTARHGGAISGLFRGNRLGCGAGNGR